MQDPNIIVVADDDARVEYNDGITFVARKVAGAPKFSVAGIVAAGAFDDVIPGEGHFFEHLPFAKTENFEDANVASYMGERGGEIGAYTTRDRTVFYGEVRKGHEKDGIHAVSDLICRPRMSTKLVLAERETILDEWAHGEMDADRQFYNAITAAAYGNNPAMLPVIGTDETILEIGLPELERFYATNYFADRLTVALEGDFDYSQVMDWAKEKFTLPRGPKRDALQLVKILPQTYILPSSQRATKTSLIYQGNSATILPKIPAESFLLAHNLFGVSGPLMREMRFGKRLVYGVGPVKNGSDTGTNYAFDSITFDAFPGKVPAAVEAFTSAIGNFLNSPDERIFDQIKRKIIADNEDDIKKNPEMGAQSLAYRAYARKVVEPKQTFLDACYKVELQDVVGAAARCFSEGAVSVLYSGQHRNDFPSHEEIARRLKALAPAPQG